MTSFEERQRDLFNQLNAAEKQANFVTRTRYGDISDKNPPPESRQRVRKTKGELKQFRGKESIFKRPEAPISQCLRARNVPDYQKNPNKWTCYSLEDVPVVSETSNVEAAAICLKETEKVNEQEMKEETIEDNSKVVFKRPENNTKLEMCMNLSDKEVVYKNSKIVLPQYVVGRREKAAKKKVEKNSDETANKCQLRLEHLHDDDESD